MKALNVVRLAFYVTSIDTSDMNLRVKLVLKAPCNKSWNRTDVNNGPE